MTLPFFSKIWVVDFEFMATPGNRPIPVCVVAKEMHTGETKKIWLFDNPLTTPPFNIGMQSLYLAYFNTAEFSCHLALGWELPQNTIDLFVEYRVKTNGRPGISNGLLGACSYFGIKTSSDVYKDSMRERILQGPPYTLEEQQQILDYCEEDVIATAKLYEMMQPGIDHPRALYRGQYMCSVAKMEHNGIPIDPTTLDRLRENWEGIKGQLIKEVDSDFNVYEDTTFKTARFEAYLNNQEIPWPRTETGRPKLDEETFKNMAATYPQLQPLKDLRYILGKMRLAELAVGSDSRNRCLLSPFRTKTGRNAPSNSKFIFGPAVWLRGLIKPEPGKVLAYIDYSQQEFYIAARLSNDKTMQQAYESGDPYLTFAKQAGAVPDDATKETHKKERDQFKICALAVQYGMKNHSLALQLGKTPAHASELIHHHKKVYKKYWEWSESVFNSTLIGQRITTLYGWQYQILGKERKEERTIKNFPVQATGAEILRVASILLSEAGIKICAPVHDALLIECEEIEAEETIKTAQTLMERAATIVLGKPIRTDADIIKYPDRYTDPRGVDTWNKILRILDQIEEIKSFELVTV